MYRKNKKYQQIVASGKELYWKHGIKRVSVEEICKEAHVSKVTFYKFFPNKIELAKEILKQLVEKPLSELESLIKKDCPFIDKVNRMLEMKMEGTQGVSSEFINDVYKNPEFGLIEFMTKYGEKSMALTIEFLKDSQKKGFIRKNMKIEFILHYLNQIISLATDNQLLNEYEKPEDLIMELTEFFFYGIGAKSKCDD